MKPSKKAQISICKTYMMYLMKTNFFIIIGSSKGQIEFYDFLKNDQYTFNIN